MSESPQGVMRFLSHASHTASITQSVCDNPNAHTSSAHSLSLLIENGTSLVREEYAFCEERLKDDVFSKIEVCFSQVTDLWIS